MATDFVCCFCCFFQTETTESYRVENCTQVSSRKIGKWKKRRLQKVSQLRIFITALHNHRIDVCHTVANFLVHHITTQPQNRCLPHSSRLPAVYTAKPLFYFLPPYPKGGQGCESGISLSSGLSFDSLFLSHLLFFCPVMLLALSCHFSANNKEDF